MASENKKQNKSDVRVYYRNIKHCSTQIFWHFMNMELFELSSLRIYNTELVQIINILYSYTVLSADLHYAK